MRGSRDLWGRTRSEWVAHVLEGGHEREEEGKDGEERRRKEAGGSEWCVIIAQILAMLGSLKHDSESIVSGVLKRGTSGEGEGRSRDYEEKGGEEGASGELLFHLCALNIAVRLRIVCDIAVVMDFGVCK